MKCPYCNQEMKCKTTYHSHGMAFWDYDEIPTYTIETHICKECKIKCVIDYSSYISEQSWLIPEQLKPSDKQKNAILFINYRLHMHEICHTKKDAWKFINKYLNVAIEQKKHDENEIEWWMEWYNEPF